MAEKIKWKKWLPFLAGNTTLVALDQWSKYLARTKLDRTDGFSLIPGIFKLQYLENRGAAFGLMQNKLTFFFISTMIILIGLTFLYTKLPETPRFLPVKYCFIGLTAGAIGNLIDRVLFNYVTDFLYFEWINFPIFNVADCYVTISATLFILLAFFYYKDEDWEIMESIFKRK